MIWKNMWLLDVLVTTGLWFDFLCNKELKKLANTPSPGVDVLADFTGSIYNITYRCKIKLLIF
jgi:hypothetical protein